VIAALHMKFFGFLRRRRGVWFALGCVPWYVLYLWCAGFGFAWGTLLHRCGSGRVSAAGSASLDEEAGDVGDLR
jgi:hypothetical protein